MEGVGEEFENDAFEGAVIESRAAGRKFDGEVGGTTGGMSALPARGGEAVGPISAGVAGGAVTEGGAGSELGNEVQAAHLLGETASGVVDFAQALAQGIGGGLASGREFSQKEGGVAVDHVERAAEAGREGGDEAFAQLVQGGGGGRGVGIRKAGGIVAAIAGYFSVGQEGDGHAGE